MGIHNFSRGKASSPPSLFEYSQLMNKLNQAEDVDRHLEQLTRERNGLDLGFVHYLQLLEQEIEECARNFNGTYREIH